MNEVLKERLKESIGKEVKIFLENGFRYIGKITNCDENYVEILDYKTNSFIIIEIKNIDNAEVSIGNKGGNEDARMV